MMLENRVMIDGNVYHRDDGLPLSLRPSSVSFTVLMMRAHGKT